VQDGLPRLGRCFASAFADGWHGVDPKESPMPDTRAHDEVYRPDGGLQWVASQRIHSAGCQHLDLAKRPSQIDDDQLLRLVLWLADGGVRRQAARDQFGGSRPKVPPGRPGPLSMGARVGPSSRPEPEPTKPEPEPPPQPTKPPEPEPPKPEAISAATPGKAERIGYRLGRGIAIVLLVAVVAVPVAWWLIARS
jgi:hypothetical protein